MEITFFYILSFSEILDQQAIENRIIGDQAQIKRKPIEILQFPRKIKFVESSVSEKNLQILAKNRLWS